MSVYPSHSSHPLQMPNMTTLMHSIKNTASIKSARAMSTLLFYILIN
jgi:hypothetical protein